MGKIFETDENIVKMVEQEFGKTGLETYGLNLRVMSVSSQRDIIKVSKASASTEFMMKKDDIIQVFVYERAFNCLDDESANMLLEMAFSSVSYDTSKDKVSIESNPFVPLFGMRKKYGDKIDNILESSYILIKQIAEKEKEDKK